MVARINQIRHLAGMYRRLLLPLFIALLPTACGKAEKPELATMKPLERESYLALYRYYECMKPYVRSVKGKPNLTDRQIARFGWHCPSELRDAATKRERYFSSEPVGTKDDAGLVASSRLERVKLHERDLAGTFYCDLRHCQITD